MQSQSPVDSPGPTEFQDHADQIDRSGRETSRSKYLVLSLAEKKFGMPLSKVKEVIGLTKITPVPHVPAFFKGLINLRGKVISVIDLRVKMNVEVSDYQAKKTSIVITEVDGLTIGAIVDDVDEVVGYQADQIKTDLDISTTVSRKFITGVAKQSDKHLVLLLDVEKIFSSEELGLLQNQTQKKAA